MKIEIIELAAQHARTARLAIGPFDQHLIPESATKHNMLLALEAAELDMICTLNYIAADQRTSVNVCGHWNTQELVSHLADWDSYFLAWLKQLCDGPPNELYFDNNGERFNNWLQTQRVGQSWDRVWQDFRGNWRAIIETLATVSTGEFFQVKDAPFRTVYHCTWSALEHYLDHAAGIRRELRLPLPEEVLNFHGPYTD